MIKPKDLTCRMCVYSDLGNRKDYLQCRRHSVTELPPLDYWCGEGKWACERPGFPRWHVTRDQIFLFMEMDGELLDPWSENA